VCGTIRVMPESLFATLKRRFSLFLFGARNGVSLNYLSSSSHGVFSSLESLIKFESELSNKALIYIPVAQRLYRKVVSKQPIITNIRWNSGIQLFSLLYCIIRIRKPKVIVETGVANGISTNAIMSALRAVNSNGALYSFDVLPQTSQVYTGAGQWHFNLLPKKKTAKSLMKTVSKMSKVDIWLHDSDHGYRWQKFEYILALRRLNRNGILISDDVDATPAWGELARTHFRKSYILYDSSKFVGIAFK